MRKRLTVRKLVEAHKGGYFIVMSEEEKRQIYYNPVTNDQIMESLCEYENIEEDNDIDMKEMFRLLTKDEISELREKISKRRKE